MAISLRYDGSVNRMQIDKIYVLTKLISEEGRPEKVFLGAAEPECRGAEVLLEAVKSACNTTLDRLSDYFEVLHHL